MVNTQLDLFGQIEAAEQVAAHAAASRAARTSAFRDRATLHADGSPVLWTAPYYTATGMNAGDTCTGWRCWICGQINPSEFVLGLNHGLHETDHLVHERTSCLNTRDAAQHSQESWRLSGHAG
jgi:hypothetical protein